MHTTTKFAPDFTTAARKALLVHPEKQSNSYTLDEVAEAVADCMAQGRPESVVMMWGREFALTLLVVLDMEGPVVDKLREAIESGLSFWDNDGELPEIDLSVPAISPGSAPGQRLVWLALEAREASRVDAVPVEVLNLRGLLQSVYRLHGDKLPRVLFWADYQGFGIDERPVSTDWLAELLYAGAAGPFVHELGREFAGFVAQALADASLVQLADLMAYAVKACKTPYDHLGHLDYRSKELALYV